MLDLYDAVGHGMWAYSRAAFRVRRARPRALRSRARDADRDHAPARDRRAGDRPAALLRHGRHAPEHDAGACTSPRGTTCSSRDSSPVSRPTCRRGLAVSSTGSGSRRWLPVVNVFPIRSAHGRARRGGARRPTPTRRSPTSCRRGCPTCGSAPRAAGFRRPARAGDVLRGEYADLLWQPITPDDRDGLDDFWSGRAAQAAGDFRTLVEIVRDGNVLARLPGRTALARRGDRPDPARHRRARPPRAAGWRSAPWRSPTTRSSRGRTRVHLALGEPRRARRRTTSRAPCSRFFG